MLKRKRYNRQQYRIAKKYTENTISLVNSDLRSLSAPEVGSNDNIFPQSPGNDSVITTISDVIINSFASTQDHSEQEDEFIDGHDKRLLENPVNVKSYVLQDYDCSSTGNISFQDRLADWSVRYQIPHNALDDLLKLLRCFSSLIDLPTDSRTLLNSPRLLTFKDITPGKYFHFGLKGAVSILLKKLKITNLTTVELCVNIDGIPLTRSSGSQLYPILCNLYRYPREVSVIGIYHGLEKPAEANELLEDFINEAVELINDGFLFNNHSYPFRIKAFICDVPAKCFISYTVGHMGYDSCSKCYAHGKYCFNRMCFPKTEGLCMRTDAEFRRKINERHHSGISLLEKLPHFDMIDGLVLDYMHLICLGTVRKLLYLWSFDTKSGSKLSRKDMDQISNFLISQSSNIPCEFARRPRSLLEVKRWKATEFRQFLFYTGPVILKTVLPAANYANFLSLYLGTLILTCPNFLNNIDNARQLMKYFVETFKVIYGVKNMSHNIHNMLHICDDVENMGVLDLFSAFPFENKLQKFKKLVRKGDTPLAQIVKRIIEIEKCEMEKENIDDMPSVYSTAREHNLGPLLDDTQCPQYMELHFANLSLKISEPNNCCLLNDGSIVSIQNFATKSNQIVLIGYRYLSVDDLFKSPCKSSDFNIYVISNPGPLEVFAVGEVANKCVKLDFENKNVVFPLLHTEK